MAEATVFMRTDDGKTHAVPSAKMHTPSPVQSAEEDSRRGQHDAGLD